MVREEVFGDFKADRLEYGRIDQRSAVVRYENEKMLQSMIGAHLKTPPRSVHPFASYEFSRGLKKVEKTGYFRLFWKSRNSPSSFCPPPSETH